MFATIERAVDALATAFAAVAVLLLAAMAVIGTADVVAFNVLSRPVPAANEIASAMLPLVVMLAMSEVQRRDGHIRVDFVSNVLPAAIRRWLPVLYALVALVVFGLLAWGASDLAASSVRISERAIAAIRFPVWPVKLVFAAGATLVALQILVQLTGAVRSAVRGEAR